MIDASIGPRSSPTGPVILHHGFEDPNALARVIAPPCLGCGAALPLSLASVLDDRTAVRNRGVDRDALVATFGLSLRHLGQLCSATTSLGITAHAVDVRCSVCGAVHVAMFGYGELQPARYVATFDGLIRGEVVAACPPTIALGEVRLRPLRADDADALFAYLQDPRVTALTSYPEVTRTLVDGIIGRAQGRWAAGELSKWAVARVGDDSLLGTCGFNEWSRTHRWAELAFELVASQWGRGVMSRAVAAVLDWVLAAGLVDRVHAFVRVDNERSRRTLLRAGFVHEGCLRSFRVCHGQRFDFDLYARLLK